MSSKITNGVEFPISWIFKLDANTPKDITGFTVLIQIRATKNSTTILSSYTEVSPEVTVTPLAGRVDLIIPPDTTSTFTFSKAVMDCWIRDGINVDGDRSEAVELIYDTGVSRL